jgi:C4-dicarboxylate-specific signal transduction histidine kinase
MGIRVNVVDNAAGIPPEHRRRLFQAFCATKGEQETGIGL